MDPCTDPRNRRTGRIITPSGNFPREATRRRADRLLIAVLVILAAIAFGAFASKAIANAAHDAQRAGQVSALIEGGY